MKENLKSSTKTEAARNRTEPISLRPEQSGASALTWFGVGVSISLGAAVGRCLLVVLLLREAQGKGLAGACRAVRLRVSQAAVAAALLGSVWEMERHTPLGLKHPHPNPRKSTTTTKKTRSVRLEELLLSFIKVRVLTKYLKKPVRWCSINCLFYFTYIT